MWDGRSPAHLHQELAEVGFHDLDAVVLEGGVELNLLGSHRLALDHHLDLVVVQHLQRRRNGARGVGGSVHDGPDRLGGGRELLDELRHAVQRGLAAAAQVGLAALEVASAEGGVAAFAQLRQRTPQGHRQRLDSSASRSRSLNGGIAWPAAPAAISASSLPDPGPTHRDYQGMRW